MVGIALIKDLSSTNGTRKVHVITNAAYAAVWLTHCRHGKDVQCSPRHFPCSQSQRKPVEWLYWSHPNLSTRVSHFISYTVTCQSYKNQAVCCTLGRICTASPSTRPASSPTHQYTLYTFMLFLLPKFLLRSTDPTWPFLNHVRPLP